MQNFILQTNFEFQIFSVYELFYILFLSFLIQYNNSKDIYIIIFMKINSTYNYTG